MLSSEIAGYIWLFLFSAMVFISLPFFPVLNELLKHGKSARTAKIPAWLFISKNNFKYFYIIGILCGLYSLALQFNLLKIAFIVHLFRRYYETAYYFNSKTTMNLLQALFGIVFYPLVWCVISININQFTFSTIISTVLLSVAGYLQFLTHYEMSLNKNKDILPDKWMFKIVICPNFMLELVIYLALFVGIQTWPVFVLFLNVLFNQIASAVDRKKSYPRVKIMAIIPFVV